MVIEIVNGNVDLNCEDRRSAITNLLNAYKLGFHIVLFKISFLDCIIKSTKFGENEKRNAVNLKTDIRQIHNVLSLVKYQCKVNFDLDDTCITNSGTEIHVGYKYFISTRAINPITLISEDDTDIEFYTYVAKSYLSVIKQRSMNVIFESYPGGGSRTKRNFNNRKANNLLSLCLVDNDKKHPKGEMGSTRKAFSNDDLTLDKTVLCVDIDMHEIESLIPISCINQLIENDTDGKYNSNHIKSLELLKKLTTADNTTKFYFDHKNGLTVNKVINLDRKHGKYWVPLLTAITTNECMQKGKCICADECKLIDGFFDTLLVHVLNLFNITSPQKIREGLPPFLEERWNFIGELLFNWGCSLSKKRQ